MLRADKKQAQTSPQALNSPRPVGASAPARSGVVDAEQWLAARLAGALAVASIEPTHTHTTKAGQFTSTQEASRGGGASWTHTTALKHTNRALPVNGLPARFEDNQIRRREGALRAGQLNACSVI